MWNFPESYLKTKKRIKWKRAKKKTHLVEKINRKLNEVNFVEIKTT